MDAGRVRQLFDRSANLIAKPRNQRQSEPSRPGRPGTYRTKMSVYDINVGDLRILMTLHIDARVEARLCLIAFVKSSATI